MATCTVAYGDNDNKYVDECWHKLRAESKSIRYVMIGTLFVAKGAYSEDADAQVVPSKDVLAPLEATWLVSFEKLSMRRTQRYPIFQAGEPPYLLRSTTDVYTKNGGRVLRVFHSRLSGIGQPQLLKNT